MGNSVVLGAGVTGLTVALKTSEAKLPLTVLEKSPHVGGMAASFTHEFQGDRFILDYGPHKIYTQLPQSLELMKQVLGGDLLEKPKKSKIRFNGKYFDYPMKIGQVLLGLGLPKTASFGLGFVSSKFSKRDENTYSGYLQNRFGTKIYETIFRDLAQKVWGDPETLDSELARTRLAASSLPEMAFKMLSSAIGLEGGGKEISAKVFYYPKHGIGELSDKMAARTEKNGGQLFLNSQPAKIVLKNNRVAGVRFSSSKKESTLADPDFVFSTIPLLDLVSLFTPQAPESVLKAASKLKYRSLVLLYVIAKKERLFDDSFIFFPEKEFVFNRLSEQKGFSEYCGPKDKTVLCAEISCDPDSKLYKSSDSEIFEYAWPSLEKTGFISRQDVTSFFTKKARRVYPVYDVGFKKNLYEVLDWLDGIENLLTLGRQGLFNYNNTDHCVDMGLSACKNISLKQKTRLLDAWKGERTRFENYVIVD